jgi:hypothetical protein
LLIGFGFLLFEDVEVGHAECPDLVNAAGVVARAVGKADPEDGRETVRSQQRGMVGHVGAPVVADHRGVLEVQGVE